MKTLLNGYIMKQSKIFILLGIFAILTVYAGAYRLISISELDFKKCFVSNPESGILVWAVKQPLFESKNKSCYRKSIKKNIGVFAIRIENKGTDTLLLDLDHVKFLDGSGNEFESLSADTVAKLLGGGNNMKSDLSAYPIVNGFLLPGKIHYAFIYVRTKGDPYFATYYLRFFDKNGKKITDARF